MPSWGRPSRAGKGKREKRRDRNTRHWEEDRRFEEIDSDEDDGQGVGLHDSLISDKLYFTGADLGPRRRQPHKQDHSQSSESSGNEDNMEDRSGGVMQVALRGKEEQLVQKAMERIRRAQLMGRSNVKLTKPEIDALERKRLKDYSTNKILGPKLRIADRRRVSDRLPKTVNEQKPSRRKAITLASVHDDHSFSGPKHTTPPGAEVSGSNGNPVYSATGQYQFLPAGSYGRSSRSGSRSTSAQSQQRYTPPLPGSQFRPAQTRYFSVPEHSRPSSMPQTPPLSRRLPDDPSWIPRPRSASSNHLYPAENIQHNAHSPPLHNLPSQFNQGRRNTSGQPEIQYTSTRRGAPLARAYATSSEPPIPQTDATHEVPLEHHVEVDYSDDDDDDNYGVQVGIDSYLESYGSNGRPEDYAGGWPRRGER